MNGSTFAILIRINAQAEIRLGFVRKLGSRTRPARNSRQLGGVAPHRNARGIDRGIEAALATAFCVADNKYRGNNFTVNRAAGSNWLQLGWKYRARRSLAGPGVGVAALVLLPRRRLDPGPGIYIAPPGWLSPPLCFSPSFDELTAALDCKARPGFALKILFGANNISLLNAAAG